MPIVSGSLVLDEPCIGAFAYQKYCKLTISGSTFQSLVSGSIRDKEWWLVDHESDKSFYTIATRDPANYPEYTPPEGE